ncbi:MAG: DUF1761 domain-containing protein [Bacteroidetes bacterium]|nr:DUF1761 domain-containing protein [Bacteroidota bacterium]
MDAPVNYLAILVAGLIPMILGSIWYGPLFGKKWMELEGKTEEELKAGFNPLKSYGVTFLFALLMAYVQLHVLDAFFFKNGLTGAMAGVQGGFWIWLGFVVTIGWQQVAFSGQNIVLWLINSLYNLTALIAMGAVLSVWK